MKICFKCKKLKSLKEFHKSKDKKDGVVSLCKICAIQKSKDYYEENKDSINEKRKANYLENKEKINDRNKKWRKNNKEKVKESKKKYQEQHKEKNKLYFKQWNLENKAKSKKRKVEYRNSKAIYTLGNKIAWYDYTECSEDGYLIVKCRYCGKKFIPKVKQVFSRAGALNGLGVDQNSLYCSSGCKKACPTFNQKFHYKGQKIDGSSREVQPELRQMCLERDEYTCQKCGAKGKTVQLHCHHIYPLNESPITSADVDNCITLCKSCHKEAHKIAGCNNFELRCSSN